MPASIARAHRAHATLVVPVTVVALVASGVLLVSLGSASAQGQPSASAAAGPVRPWSAEDLVLAERLSQPTLAPDGSAVVWVKSTGDKEKDARVSNLVLTILDTKRHIQLTRGPDSNSRPRWSPDGGRIAFLSTRDRRTPKEQANPEAAATQLWLIERAGGEAWPVTDLTRGIRRFEWLDNDTIVFSAEEDPALHEQEAERKKDKSKVIEDEARTAPVRLFAVRVADKRITRLTTNADWIGHWELSPTGRFVAAQHERSLRYEWDQAVAPKYFIHDLSSGESREIVRDGRVRPDEFRWLPDGATLLAVARYSSDTKFVVASVTRLYAIEAATGAEMELALDWDRGLAGPVEVVDDGFVTLLADGVRQRLARYSRTAEGWTRANVSGDHVANITEFDVSRDGRLVVYAYSTASTPVQLFSARLDGATLVAAAQLTDLNPAYKSRTVARTEVIRWKGANGAEIEGLLYYPRGYEPGTRYPLITAPHGGPLGADLDIWDDDYAYPNNLWAERGAFVVRPNYHGSSHYGLAFAESICCGKYYELPVKDIEAGVDHLVGLGLVDPERIGTMGWSNGSILSTGLMIANPARYKAASVGAGDVEWLSDWANVDFGHSFDSYYFGGSPLEIPQRYIELSPLFKLDRVQTPTLIFFGTEDRNVPTDQGWTHFRALQHLGKAPVRFILFPGEPHGLQKLTHQRRKLDEELAWFDTHLFKTAPRTDDIVKQDSPLDLALRRAGAKSSGGAFGVAASGNVLVPETASRVIGGKTLHVGRFEVTRAQYAAFDRTYEVAPGTGNFPANGITFDQAQAYAAWLSKQTGAAWRLLRESEASDVYPSPSAGENTLDHWAGYAPNPEDARQLAARVAKLGTVAPLLKEVGSFKPAGEKGEDPIYDLGGNVAEWIVSADGTGKAVGGSADRPADSKRGTLAAGKSVAASDASPEYRGIRVIVER